MDSSKNFISIFKDLVDYQSFIEFLSKIPQQTPMMVKNQVIKADRIYNDKITKIMSSPNF